MAYQTNTAGSPTDLLQKLVAWLALQGWVVDLSASAGTKGGWKAHLHKGSLYVHLRAVQVNSDTGDSFGYGMSYEAGPGIQMYVGSGYTPGLWQNQPGAPIGVGQTYSVGNAICLPEGVIRAYHFLCDESGDHVRVIVERQAGSFSHLMWGSTLEKLGNWPGGAYFCGGTQGNLGQESPATSTDLPFSVISYRPLGYVRVDVDETTGWAGLAVAGGAANDGATGVCASGLVGKSDDSFNFDLPEYPVQLLSRTVSTLNSQAALLPAHLFVLRAGGGWSPLGTVPGLFYTRATESGFAVGSTYPLGADSYLLFPGFALRKA
jgi:hypothetical protein